MLLRLRAIRSLRPTWRISRSTRLRPEALAVGHLKLGVDARRPIDLAVVFVDLADPLKQPRILKPAGRRLASLPGTKARAADAEHAAHRLDRMVGLLLRDQPEDHRGISLS